jgi:hypothetical protein
MRKRHSATRSPTDIRINHAYRRGWLSVLKGASFGVRLARNGGPNWRTVFRGKHR